MRVRVVIACGVLAAGAAAVAAAILLTGRGGELTGELGLTADPPFFAELSGGLYDARTLTDEDGAADVAYLTGDRALAVRVRGADARSGIAQIAVRVDGRSQTTRRARCATAGCPAVLVGRFTPRIVAHGPGTHRVEVLAGGSARARAVSVGAFQVRVGSRMPASVEVEPPRVRAGAVLVLDRRRPAVDRVVRAAARRGALARIVGASRLTLRERGAGAGIVTVLADVRPARRDVTAVLPQPGDDGPARMRARILSDLLLDIDLRRNAVVAIQPGPASSVSAWTQLSPRGTAQAETEDDAPSAAFTATRPPRLLRLSDSGPAFFAQDGDPTLRRNGRDWPVSIVFSGAATIPKVKAALRGMGLVRRGHPRSLGYRLPRSGLLRFDGDTGLKTPCDGDATDLHVRLYAPPTIDRFVDPEFGTVVLATVHLDHVDGCGVGPLLFGFSERAERALGALIARRLRWKVAVDELALGNGEPLRRDAADPGHVWLANGAATRIIVP